MARPAAREAATLRRLMVQSYEAVRREALDALAAGEPQRAFSQIRRFLEYPGELDSDARWADALDVFARIAAVIAGDALAGHARAAAARPDSVEAVYSLGYELVEQALHGFAATVLARARALDPEDAGILFELVAALEGCGANQEACRFLREAGPLVDQSFLARYLLSYNALMTGDLEEPRRLLPGLSALLSREGPEEGRAHMHAALAGMLARADALRGAAPLDAQDLRGWHFVITGGLLLHVSPYGFDEGMNGRYAYTQDSEARCLEGIRRLEAALSAWKLAPPRVFVLPHRESAALAHAAAAVLGLPAAPWPEGGTADPGLIITYDLSRLDGAILESLGDHRPGQILFAHAASWTEEPPFAADLTTYLYQINAAPWDARLGFDPEKQAPVEVPADESSVETLAERIANASLEEGSLADIEGLAALAEAAARAGGDAAPGAMLTGGARRRQRAGSPVKSSRFY